LICEAELGLLSSGGFPCRMYQIARRLSFFLLVHRRNCLINPARTPLPRSKSCAAVLGGTDGEREEIKKKGVHLRALTHESRNPGVDCLSVIISVGRLPCLSAPVINVCYLVSR